MSSQLVAAENLSECLSKQMEALTLKAPSNSQKNVKKLFETIGIPYEASFGSSDMKGLVETPLSRKPMLFYSSTKKDWLKRNRGSPMNCEPEMARRNRDSLDKVSFVYTSVLVQMTQDQSDWHNLLRILFEYGIHIL